MSPRPDLIRLAVHSSWFSNILSVPVFPFTFLTLARLPHPTVLAGVFHGRGLPFRVAVR